MEELEIGGLVIRETKTGDADKIVTLLTAERGRISVSGKGVSSLRSKYAASARLFSYSTFLLRKTNRYWYIRDAFYIDSFTELGEDLEKLSLANYVAEAAYEVAREEFENPALLSLTLNTLYAVARTSLPLEQIRGAFEFRMAAQEGFAPDLSACGVCGAPLGQGSEDCTLDVMNGRLLCRKCRAAAENDPAYYEDETAKIFIRVSPPVLAALRFIAAAPPKKFLSFSLGKEELSLFSVVCERYLLNHLEHGFSSLEYYKKIRG